MGGTNPFAIVALQKKDVIVRHLDTLHAKVYIGDEDAVVTSANASKNGLGLDNETGPFWLEAGVIVSSQIAISWFNSLWHASNIVKSSDLDIALLEFSKAQNKNKVDSSDEEVVFGRSLLNMSVRRATAAVLSRTRRPMTAAQIAEVLTAADFETVSSPYRAVYEALRGGLRREFVHLERGLWAHSNWPEYAEYTLSESEVARLVPLHSGFDRLRPGEPWDHWSDPKYDLLELSLLHPRPEHRSACQRSLPDLAASGANPSKPLCRGTRACLQTAVVPRA